VHGTNITVVFRNNGSPPQIQSRNRVIRSDSPATDNSGAAAFLTPWLGKLRREVELIELSSGEETDASQGGFGMKSRSTWRLVTEVPVLQCDVDSLGGGVAYRCAVGRVLREVWEEHAIEWVNGADVPSVTMHGSLLRTVEAKK